MKVLVENNGLNIAEGLDSLQSVIPKMDGYVAADLKSFIDIARHVAIADSGKPSFMILKLDTTLPEYFGKASKYFTTGSTEDVVIKRTHLEEAIENYIPFGLIGVDLKPPESKITLADVGGLSTAKTTLAETLKWPTQVKNDWFFFFNTVGNFHTPFSI